MNKKIMKQLSEYDNRWWTLVIAPLPCIMLLLLSSDAPDGRLD